MRRSGFLALAGALPVVRTDPATLRILVLGDSLALATGASQADGGFIFPLFRELLPAHPGARLDNVAIGGSTVADVLRLQLPQVTRSVPNIIIVCVGGNDVVRMSPVPAFNRTYRALLDGLRQAAPHAQIICCGVPDVAASPLFADERTTIARRSAADDAVVRAAARAQDARFVDFFAVTAQRVARDAGFFSADRFHPSDAGYALLRAALRPALAAAVARARTARNRAFHSSASSGNAISAAMVRASSPCR